jgi:hypothetical protein
MRRWYQGYDAVLGERARRASSLTERSLGRAKDLADIRLIENYLSVPAHS